MLSSDWVFVSFLNTRDFPPLIDTIFREKIDLANELKDNFFYEKQFAVCIMYVTPDIFFVTYILNCYGKQLCALDSIFYYNFKFESDVKSLTWIQKKVKKKKKTITLIKHKKFTAESSSCACK